MPTAPAPSHAPIEPPGDHGDDVGGRGADATIPPLEVVRRDKESKAKTLRRCDPKPATCSLIAGRLAIGEPLRVRVETVPTTSPQPPRFEEPSSHRKL